jgi:hypothetical protein
VKDTPTSTTRLTAKSSTAKCRKLVPTSDVRSGEPETARRGFQLRTGTAAAPRQAPTTSDDRAVAAGARQNTDEKADRGDRRADDACTLWR